MCARISLACLACLGCLCFLVAAIDKHQHLHQHLRRRAQHDSYTIDMVMATFMPPDLGAIDAERNLWSAQLEAMRSEDGKVQNATSWNILKQRRYVIKHVFVLCAGGHGIEAPDILLLRCEETYQMLHTKTMEYFKQVMEMVPGARLYAKRDLDAVPCLGRILRASDLVWLSGQTSQYIGALNYNSKVHHNPSDRWYDRLIDEIAPHQTAYWPYHQGAFYMLSADLLYKVLRNKDFLQAYYMEDAMVGSWVVGLRKEIINLKFDDECMCRSTADVYHHCTAKWQIDHCFDREHSRCYSVHD